MLTTLSVMISLCLVLIFRFINKKYNSPIFGVYQRRNKYFWLKFFFMYTFLRLKQLATHIKRLLAVELGYSYDGTVHIHEHDIALEQKHPLGDHPQAVDAVYFNGMSDSGAAVICGVARRPDNICDAFLYLKVEDGDLLLSPSLPDTHLEQTVVEEGQYRVQGISVNNFIPMRTWKVSYYGEMKSKSDPEKRLRVEMNLTWSAKWNAFSYDRHMSPRCMAQDVAREDWSADYFKLLKKFHQVHYEQMGFLDGAILVDGKEHIVQNMPCVRDHSYGNSRYKGVYIFLQGNYASGGISIDRYVYHFMYLENGDCMAVGAVSQPVILSHLTIGYLCRKSDQAVVTVDECDFNLWQHGEHQILPKDYGFVFRAGGESYQVKVKVHEESSFYIGRIREAKFYERWSSVEVNGVKGWSCAEWQYNNVAAASNA